MSREHIVFVPLEATGGEGGGGQQRICFRGLFLVPSPTATATATPAVIPVLVVVVIAVAALPVVVVVARRRLTGRSLRLAASPFLPLGRSAIPVVRDGGDSGRGGERVGNM